MDVKYLSYGQAAAISADHQHLIGLPFTNDGAGAVQAIVVAPYSKILQWKFADSIAHGVPLQEALRLCVNGRYEVLVLAAAAGGGHQFRFLPLRDYLRLHGMPFNEQAYKCLRLH